MDTLDINDAHYDRKILDLQRRYDEQYDTIEKIEVQIGELQSQIRSIQQEKISGDNIYRLLLAFDEVYHSATEAEQKEFMKAFIERIEMFPEKRKDGSWIKKIVFNFPVPVDGEEVKELPLETETTVETVAHLGITLVNKENCIGIELYISDDKSIFDSLYAEKDSIEKELGLALDWQRLDGKKASRIVYRIPGLDFDDHSNYDTLMNEAIDKIIDFSKVFKKYMK